MTHVTIWAAGSLREALREIAQRFRGEYGLEVQAEYGPSGVLRRRIEAGRRPDVFASADMGHPHDMCAFGPAHPDFNTSGFSAGVRISRNSNGCDSPPKSGIRQDDEIAS